MERDKNSNNEPSEPGVVSAIQMTGQNAMRQDQSNGGTADAAAEGNYTTNEVRDLRSYASAEKLQGEEKAAEAYWKDVEIQEEPKGGKKADGA